MVQSLEQYVAQATKAYEPSRTAIQNQIDALAGQLETTNQRINKNYAQQQSTLNRNRNVAAETASMQAAGSGGSFGGAANIANRKYYEQSFVPAQTQLQTNQANDLSQAQQNSETQRTSLNSQMSDLQAQANRSALAQYYSDLAAEEQRRHEAEEAEKQRQWQAEQARLEREASARNAAVAANNASSYMANALKSLQGGGKKVNRSQVSFIDYIKNYYNTSTSNKNYMLGLINQLGNVTNQKMLDTLNKGLQSSAAYKSYINWQNGR